MVAVGSIGLGGKVVPASLLPAGIEPAGCDDGVLELPVITSEQPASKAMDTRIATTVALRVPKKSIGLCGVAFPLSLERSVRMLKDEDAENGGKRKTDKKQNRRVEIACCL